MATLAELPKNREGIGDADSGSILDELATFTPAPKKKLAV